MPICTFYLPFFIYLCPVQVRVQIQDIPESLLVLGIPESLLVLVQDRVSLLMLILSFSPQSETVETSLFQFIVPL